MTNTRKIAVVGLGYVGLPLAVAFGKIKKIIGFDINQARVAALRDGIDNTKEVDSVDLKASNIHFTSEISEIREADFYIVAVPTPIDTYNKPDLGALVGASKTVGKVLKKGDIVVYESTVYPGCTERECKNALEEVSGLVCGVDFKLGYTPERINPGDKEHTFVNITKVVAGQDMETLDVVDREYSSVVKAGTYRASSIKVAEAAKIIENTQRDLNIALMNELAMIFHRMGIDTLEVLKAASTKWNFLKFYPGLVGGHCIGVDPYYLTYEAERFGHIPQVILAGRRINDGMGAFIAQRAIKEAMTTHHNITELTVTILGMTFKENCPDIRNSKVIDIIRELKEYSINDIQVTDPLAHSEEVQHEYGVSLTAYEKLRPADILIWAVDHNEYRALDVAALKKIVKKGGTLIDVKGRFKREWAPEIGVNLWRL